LRIFVKILDVIEFKKWDIIELEVHDYAFGGKGISKIPTEEGDYIVFIPHAIPGQKIKAKITKKKKRFAEAEITEVLTASQFEVANNFQRVSGAPYIQLPVEIQHDFKKKSVFHLYKTIGNIDSPENLFEEYISSPNDYFYRNKMEYSFSCIEQDIINNEELDDSFALGSKSKGTWWKVESLNKPSGLFDEDFEDKLKEIRIKLASYNLEAWHPPQKKGFFRHLVVRKSFKENKLLLNLVTSSNGLKKFDKKDFSDWLVNLLGDRLAGFQHTINDNVADRAKIENGQVELLYGEPVVTESLFGLNFEISMESFFQTNPECAELLYDKAINYLTEDKNLNGSNIMDLFCGTGTIGQIISKKVDQAKIVSVDIVPEAIEDAKRNAIRNGITDIDFKAEDVGKFIFNNPEYENNIEAIVVDPPRAGIAPKTLRKVCRLNANRIVYISCNPATQARDIETLNDFGYQLKKFSLVDQFPHTSHVECVALFDKVV
jgi:23S rRNA (uracil1939-C5)-methyltransferase